MGSRLLAVDPAHGRAAAALALLHVQPSLLTAIVATLIFAGIGLAYARRSNALVGPSPARLVASLAADTIIIVIVGVGGWLIGRSLGGGTAFYCDPLVPWRIEIALAGGFGVSFYSVPYLGKSLSMTCPGRSVAGVALVALGIRVGERVGLAAAGWRTEAQVPPLRHRLPGSCLTDLRTFH